MVTSHMRGAVSYHKGSAGVSWKKWDGEAFTRTNLIEESETFTDTSNNRLPSGENPSLQWNRCYSQRGRSIPLFGFQILATVADGVEWV